MTVAIWDRPLSKSEIRRLSPTDRRKRALASLERKIAAIERAASIGDTVRQRTELPNDRAKLRRWENAESGLWCWADPLFDSPTGRNAGLIARFQAAIERLLNDRRHGKAGLRDDIGVLARRVAVLDQQIADLIGQNRQLRVELSRARRRR